ncbi:hypothetical protein HID58_060347, partial [Brassica napus]
RRFFEGVPSRCWCGHGVVIFYSKTDENAYKIFYRCEIGKRRKTIYLSGVMKLFLMRFEGSLMKTVEEEVWKRKNSMEVGCLGSFLWLFGNFCSHE